MDACAPHENRHIFHRGNRSDWSRASSRVSITVNFESSPSNLTGWSRAISLAAPLGISLQISWTCQQTWRLGSARSDINPVRRNDIPISHSLLKTPREWSLHHEIDNRSRKNGSFTIMLGGREGAEREGGREREREGERERDRERKIALNQLKMLSI